MSCCFLCRQVKTANKKQRSLGISQDSTTVGLETRKAEKAIGPSILENGSALPCTYSTLPHKDVMALVLRLLFHHANLATLVSL